MCYGAFVKLEDGIEGLVHISEMSWTKRINHPSELVQIDDEVEVMVLDINKEKQEISLGMKQTQSNPWDKVADKYPPGTMVKGKVRNLTNYGAFIEIEEGIDGLLHVCDMCWTRKIGHPSEVVEEGPGSRVQGRAQRRSGTQPHRAGPEADGRRPVGDRHPRTATSPGSWSRARSRRSPTSASSSSWKPGLEGLLHISELADHKVENPEDVVKVGDEIEVKILRVDTDERKIGLSRKRVEWAEDDRSGRRSSNGRPAARSRRTQGRRRLRLRPALQDRQRRPRRKNRQMRRKPIG